MFAVPEEVYGEDSKFAPASKPTPVAIEDDAELPMIGDERGVGGVVEIVKAKYGCAKGQRLKVIGETDSLLQFEGGKTAPKNQEDRGWKWVLRQRYPTSTRTRGPSTSGSWLPPSTSPSSADPPTQFRTEA